MTPTYPERDERSLRSAKGVCSGSGSRGINIGARGPKPGTAQIAKRFRANEARKGAHRGSSPFAGSCPRGETGKTHSLGYISALALLAIRYHPCGETGLAVTPPGKAPEPATELLKRGSMRATVKLLTMLYTCANARLPWDGGPGWDPSWNPFLPLCARDDTAPARYILCCGHVVSPQFAEKLIDADVMKRGEPDKFGRPTITIGDAGRNLLARNMARLQCAYPEVAKAA